MRRLGLAGCIGLILLGATIASAQQPAANDAAFATARKAADRLNASDVTALQQDLIWTGDSNALATGEYGKRTYEAIRAFQKRIKAKQTGILRPAERTALARAAKRAATDAGFTPVTAAGVTVSYPARLVPKPGDGKAGLSFTSESGDIAVDIMSFPQARNSFDDLFTRLKAERPGRKVTYALAKPDYFVVTGAVDGMTFYMRFLKTADATGGFILRWDPKRSPVLDRIAVAMSGSLTVAEGSEPAVADTPATPEPPAPAPKPAGPPVPLAEGAPATPRTGPGVVVSAQGDVLTYASLVAGCIDVTLANGHPAKVIGGDPVNDIALVRLEDAAGAAPVAWRAAPLAAGEAVTAGTASTTVVALSGPGDDTRRVTLAAGGAGGLFDSKGALAGLTAADNAPVALRGSIVAAFLASHAVEAPGQGSGNGAVSLTCSPGKP